MTNDVTGPGIGPAHHRGGEVHPSHIGDSHQAPYIVSLVGKAQSEIAPVQYPVDTPPI